MPPALERVGRRTGEAKYFTRVEKDLAQFVREDGTIRTYQARE